MSVGATFVRRATLPHCLICRDRGNAFEQSKRQDSLVAGLATLRPLLLPALLTVLALTAYNARISREMVDFEVYRTAGRRAVAAEPLYREGDGHYTFKYLPAFAVAMAPVALLGDDGARVGWYALSCACLVLLLRWSVLALPARRWTERSLVFVAIVLLAKFYAHELLLGQSNLLLGVVLLAGLVALQ